MTTKTSRNGIDVTNAMESEIDSIAFLYDVCDAEFTSDVSFYNSFESAVGKKSWVRGTVRHKVRKVAIRESIPISDYGVQLIAEKIADAWWEE